LNKVVGSAGEAMQDVTNGSPLAVGGFELGCLLPSRCIARMTSSYVGENTDFAQQFLSDWLEVELVPQGALAEHLRAGGAGAPAFYTPAGVGTAIAEGGVPLRHAPDRPVALAAAPVKVRDIGGLPCVLEMAITTDFALFRAARGDRFGNIVFNEAARNFNPLCAMAGRGATTEVEAVVDPADIAPDAVHLPGVFVPRVV